MPNIPQFDAGNLRLNPTETGVDARAKTAQRIGMFFNQQASGEQMLSSETERLASATQQVGSETGRLGSEIGSQMTDLGRRVGSSISDAGDVAVKYMDHQQISQGAPAFANLMASATQDWNNRIKNADPNDPTIAPKFMASLNAQLDKFKDNGFYTEEGQKWAEAHVDALRQHMQEKATADMATMAGQAAVVNQQQTVNSLSATVHGDPSSLDFSLAALRSSTEGMISSSPNLTGTQASAARNEILQKGSESIVKAAAIGYIEKTATVPPWATDPKYAPYLNGAELKQWETAAKNQAKSNELTSKQTDVAQRQLDNLNVHKAANQVQTDNITFDPQTGRPIIDPKFFSQALDIARKNPDASSAAETVRTLFSWGEAQQSKSDHMTDPATASAIDSRMWVPENPTTKLDIMKAETDKKLSRSDAEIRMKLIDQRDKMPTDPQFKFAMDGAKELIEGRTSGEKSLQSGKYAAFMQQFFGEYQRQKAAGTLPANALSLRDPTSLLSKTMEAYKSPLASAISGNGGIGGGLPPASSITGISNEPAPVATSTARPAAAKPPEKGTIKDGYEFLGGSPGSAASWRKVEDRS